MACADASPFVVAGKYLDFRGMDIPTVILPDISSILASISEISVFKIILFVSFYDFIT